MTAKHRTGRLAGWPLRFALAGAIVAIFQVIAAVLSVGPRVCILGDMEKAVAGERLRSSPSFLNGRTITLHGAGNEIVAFQVAIASQRALSGLTLQFDDLVGPVTLNAAQHIEPFLQHYVRTDDASYSWGTDGGAGALPWRGRWWPDALIPFVDPYDDAHPPVIGNFAIDPAVRPLQAVWVDVWIPRGTPAGDYHSALTIRADDRPLASFDIQLSVHPFDLPDEQQIDAWGELYRETGVMFDSGVKFKDDPERDWRILRRYLQMAHAHRFTAFHRPGNGPVPLDEEGRPADRFSMRWSDDWSLFSPYIAPILDGTLFTDAEGYRGPGAGAGPTFFPAPFVEAFYGAALRTHLQEHDGRIDPELLETIEANATAFWREVQRQGWEDVRWFAYIFDEVDGAVDTGEPDTASGMSDISAIHRAFADVQRALDAGTGGRHIHLLWTSHRNAARWAGTPDDLRNTIRWWVPNGHAVNVEWFEPIARDDRQWVWFYHSGQPAVGNHTINQTGVDLRLWGLLCRRYGLEGSFWWSMMNFAGRYDDPQFNPYDHPVYHRDDTRWGNGVLFYPGSRLTMIGAQRNIEGPIPSLRMKAYRRGLQDDAYCRLADRAGFSDEVDALLRRLIPAAFSEAPDAPVRGRWSHDPEEYYAMRRTLAGWIAQARPAH